MQAQIVNLLLELQARLGLTLVFITTISPVRDISHRVAVMYLATWSRGATEALFAAPRHPYTRALIAAVPQVDPHHRSEREAVRGELPSPIAPPPFLCSIRAAPSPSRSAAR